MADSSDIVFILFLRRNLSYLEDPAYKDNKDVWKGPVRAVKGNNWVMLTTKREDVVEDLPSFELVEIIYGETMEKRPEVVSFRRRLRSESQEVYGKTYKVGGLADRAIRFDEAIQKVIMSAKDHPRVIETSGNTIWEPIGPLHGMDDPMTKFSPKTTPPPSSRYPETSVDTPESSQHPPTSLTSTTPISAPSGCPGTDQITNPVFSFGVSVEDYISQFGTETGGIWR